MSDRVKIGLWVLGAIAAVGFIAAGLVAIAWPIALIWVGFVCGLIVIFTALSPPSRGDTE